MELKFDHTGRGFARYDFEDLYGEACSLQASSLATDDAIWFGCDKPKIDHTTGQPIGQRMHLNRDQVAALIPILQHFVATGEVSQQPAAKTAIEEIEARLLALVPGPFGSFTLSFNDENGYQTVEQRLKTEEPDRLPDWISDAEREKAIAANSMWSIHFYPKGEVSFYCMAAASLTPLLDAAEHPERD